jgi:hemolysin activation/secretion protein
MIKLGLRRFVQRRLNVVAGFGLLASVLMLDTPAYAQDSGPRFAVTGYAVTGENPFSAADTQALLEPFTGEAVTLDRLQSAAAALETALKERGFNFLRVVIPPQDAQGVITLRVLAFKLNAVNVSGNQHFDTANIRASLPALQSGVTPNLREIARAQALANDHPSKQVSVTIQQGKVPDTVDAALKVEDSKPLQFFASLDNSGTKQSGHTRLGVGVSHSNLFNRDHSVTATYTTSPDGHVSDLQQYGLYYRAPFYSLGGALSAYYTKSDTNTGVVANFFNVSGSGEFMGVRWTHRLLPLGSYSHAAEIGLEDRFFGNGTTFNNVPIGTDVRSRPLLLRYTGRLDGAAYALAGNLEFASNLSGGSGNNDRAYTANRAGADSGWQAWRYALQGSRALGTWTLNAKLRGQASGDALIPGEQFGLGGANGVRGLEEREGTGDQGLLGSVELMSPQIAQGLRVLVFSDAGQVRSHQAGAGINAREGASSAGAGLRYQWRRNLSVVLDWAQVLNGAGTTNKHDNRVHASLSLRF